MQNGLRVDLETQRSAVEQRFRIPIAVQANSAAYLLRVQYQGPISRGDIRFTPSISTARVVAKPRELMSAGAIAAIYSARTEEMFTPVFGDVEIILSAVEGPGPIVISLTAEPLRS
ncbi:MAG TPA: hypothetical protein VEB03_00815 [Candidatus Nanoarchaeia archaeon]|nr:hypothetical protein [Candidatus Nanoarchaeia archaeon]